MSRHTRFMLIVSTLSLSIGSVSVAQESARKSEQDVQQAEQNIINLFNANNSTNQFDIRCQKLRVTGSHIPYRVCVPRFMRNNPGRYSIFMSSEFNILTDRIRSSRIDEDIRQLQMEFTDLMFSNTEFAKAAEDYGVLVERLELASN